MWKDVDRVGFVMVVLLLTGMATLAFGAMWLVQGLIVQVGHVFALVAR